MNTKSNNIFSLEYYKESNFKGVIVSDSIIANKEFYKCTFNNCNMNKVVFQNCRIEDCDFNNCDISLSKLNGNEFIDVRFYESKLLGIDWTEAHTINNIKFTKCKLSHSIFYGLQLKLLIIEDCLVQEVDFTNANLNKANLSKSDFQGSKFNNTDLSNADFTKSKNYDINPKHNTIKKAIFSIPEVITLLQGFDIIIK